MLFKVKAVLFTFDALAGGIIALWKSVVITVKVEIGGADAQIELREVTDKRRLYLVTKAPFQRGANANLRTALRQVFD
jgi:hypothetical protein